MTFDPAPWHAHNHVLLRQQHVLLRQLKHLITKPNPQTLYNFSKYRFEVSGLHLVGGPHVSPPQDPRSYAPSINHNFIPTFKLWEDGRSCPTIASLMAYILEIKPLSPRWHHRAGYSRDGHQSPTQPSLAFNFRQVHVLNTATRGMYGAGSDGRKVVYTNLILVNISPGVTGGSRIEQFLEESTVRLLHFKSRRERCT